MLAYDQLMKTRDNVSALIEALQRDHGLLAAYLEAIDKLYGDLVIGEPTPGASSAPHLPEVASSKSRFVYGRANLVQADGSVRASNRSRPT
jgi:hypothetical protein